MLETIRKLFPSVDRLLMLKNGSFLPTAAGAIKQQLQEAGIQESDVKAVYIRELSGLNIPIVAQHDIPKPIFLESSKGIRGIGRKEVRRLRASIKDGHSCR